MSEILDQNVIKLQQVMDSKSLGSAASPSPLKTKIQLQAVQRADMTLLFLYIWACAIEDQTVRWS